MPVQMFILAGLGFSAWFVHVRVCARRSIDVKLHSPIKHAYLLTLGLEDGRVVVDVLDEDRDGEVGGGAVPPVARQPEPSQYNSYAKNDELWITYSLSNVVNIVNGSQDTRCS